MNSIVHCINNHDVTINVKHRIHFRDVEEIINSIVDGVFEDNEYTPSRYDYYLFYMIVANYTDLDLTQFDADEIYELLEEENGIYQKISNYISNVQIQTILSSADKLINYRLNENPMKRVLDKVYSLIDSFDSFASNLNDNPNMIADILSLINAEDKDKIVKLKEVIDKYDYL